VSHSIYNLLNIIYSLIIVGELLTVNCDLMLNIFSGTMITTNWLNIAALPERLPPSFTK